MSLCPCCVVDVGVIRGLRDRNLLTTDSIVAGSSGINLGDRIIATV